MAAKAKNLWLQSTAVRTLRLHFLYVAAFMVSLVVFDSWNLLTHEAVRDFWTAAAALLVINIILWYVCRIKFSKDRVYITALQLLIVADIAFAGLVVYWERGVASSSVILFTVPIILAASLRSRSLLLATAALSAVAYSLATVRYFYEHYGEGYRVELYGEIFLYGALFFVFAGLLYVVSSPRDNH